MWSRNYSKRNGKVWWLYPLSVLSENIFFFYAYDAHTSNWNFYERKKVLLAFKNSRKNKRMQTIMILIKTLIIMIFGWKSSTISKGTF